jgi:hypothetical protein
LRGHGGSSKDLSNKWLVQVRLGAIILSARWLVEPVNSLTIARAAKNENCIARHREETFMKKLAAACAATAKRGANWSKPPASRWMDE